MVKNFTKKCGKGSQKIVPNIYFSLVQPDGIRVSVSQVSPAIFPSDCKFRLSSDGKRKIETINGPYTNMGKGLENFTGWTSISGRNLPISFDPAPYITIASLPGVSFSFLKNKTAALDSERNSGPGIIYFRKPTIKKTQKIPPVASGIYKVSVTNQFSFSIDDATEMLEICKSSVFVSNSFTSNKYGSNGYYNREQMTIGVYPWIFTYKWDTKKYKGSCKMLGSVTVIR